MILQVAPRIWNAGAVHDTVQAVVQGPAFRRSIQSSVAERMLGWIAEWLAQLFRYFEGRTSARILALTLVAVLVALVIARLVLAARARDDGDAMDMRGGRLLKGEDHWRAAERLASEGRYEDSAHAIYRGVLASLALSERVRLHPSKTSGDYARELRARGSTSQAPFRAFGRRFDVAVYGRGGCDAALIDDLVRLAAPFRSRARAA